jgi:methylenetetrahydrofolate dehydrogenase (NADP+)/methenyltetrahydrofolate cyclohydrolase
MTAKIIDGKEIAVKVRQQWKQRVDNLKESGILPGLAVIIVGDNPASRVYVRNKIKACHEVGMHSELHDLPEDISEPMLLETIGRLNQDKTIHGILVQLPLPDHIDVNRVLETIAVEKDVDGFHLYNLGGLVAGNTVFPPCTPYGVQCLLEYCDIPIEGENAVIVGRSNIVGKPMALMLLQKSATVTVCTSKTKDLKQFTSLADILVVATGKPNLITAEMVKPGATVIDVGINRLEDGRLVGDVDFQGVQQVAGYITPVPGGVGPMTITMLVANTVIAAEQMLGSESVGR